MRGWQWLFSKRRRGQWKVHVCRADVRAGDDGIYDVVWSIPRTTEDGTVERYTIVSGESSYMGAVSLAQRFNAMCITPHTLNADGQAADLTEVLP